jgi:hypothetical protein
MQKKLRDDSFLFAFGIAPGYPETPMGSAWDRIDNSAYGLNIDDADIRGIPGK